MSNVLVIGASSGIGREAARALAAEGHRLVLSARREEPLRVLAAELPGGSGAHAVCPADAGDSASIDGLLDTAERELGPLDAVIYSAGSARVAKVEETSDAMWAEVLSGNLNGLFYTARAALPRFRARGRGHLVAVLSISARQGFPNWSAYTAAKHGALGFLECLRAESRGAGIHVTAVIPGATDTPLWDGLGPEWDRSRMMRPSQVAACIAAALREEGGGMVEEIRITPVGGSL